MSDYETVIKEMESVEGFMFPNSELGKVVTEYKDTFSGLDILMKPSSLNDNVNHPKHYTSHPSGVEAIEITRWLRGPYSNACKYVMRGWEGLKGDPVEDLEKALWYLNDAEKFPDDGRFLPTYAATSFVEWYDAEVDANKADVVYLIVAANEHEGHDFAPMIPLTNAKKLIQERIAYLQSRPDVAL